MSNQNYGGQKAVYSQSFSRSGPRRDAQPRGERNFQFEPSDDKDVIQVDSRKLGCIIGTKGSNIRKMEEDSGAQIQVSKDRNGASSDVYIKGTPEARQAAHEMIQNCIDDDNNRRNDSNQSRSGGYDNQSRSGGYENQSRSGGFDNQSRSGGYDNQSNSGGFDNQSRSGGYNNQSRSGGFDNQSRSSGYDNQSRFGGYDNQSRSGGYDGESRSGGYNGQSRSGGYNNQSRSGGYDSQSRSGGYDGQSRSGGYDGQSRSGGYDNQSRSGGYDNQSRSGGFERKPQYERRSNYADTNDDRRRQNNNQNSNTDTSNSDFQPIDWQALYEQSELEAKAKLAAMPSIVKNLYHEDPEVANMSPQEVAFFRANKMDIKVERVFGDENEKSKPIPNPVLTFEQAFGPYPDILKTIYEQEFKEPSPIQSQAWPIILSGEDMIGIAQTGTGKTLAFLLPALIHIESQVVPRNERVGPTVLILSPTRELALQIEKEINKYSYHGIKCVCVYGGGARREQGNILAQKPEIVVATPGRLEDFISTDQILLDSVTYVVLDEADKMLEMGFEVQIRRILLKVRGDRQSLLTSATWPSGVRRLVSQYSNNPIQVVVGSLDLTAVHSVTQRIEIIDEDNRRERLSEFLAGMEPDDKVIVFCSKKSVTDDIASDLMLQGVKCQSIHGDREQCDREQALHDLKTGEVHILIATDVAARGIDIPDITHIFNYDFPRNIEEYVHRIGRTGRAGKSGESISLVTRKDWGSAAELIKILEEANQGVPDELRSMAERFEKKKNDGPFRGRGGGGFRGGRGSRPRY